MKIAKYLFVCLFLSACIFGTSQNAKFYSLISQKSEVLSSKYDSSVGIGRVLLPKYVDKPQIITLNNDSPEVIVSEYNRWIESPSVLCGRVLLQDLSSLLPNAQINTRLFGTEVFERTISVEVIKMDGILGDKATLETWYSIKNKQGTLILRRKFARTISIGKSYDDLVGGYALLWQALSKEIANDLIER